MTALLARAGTSRRTRPFPPHLAMLGDAAAWLFAIVVVTLSRLLFAEVDFSWSSILVRSGAVAAGCIVLMLIGGWVTGLYRRRFIAGSLDELGILTAVVFGVSLLASLVIVGTGVIPRSVAFVLLPYALVCMAALRLVYRGFSEQRSGPADDSRPVLLFGAGELGHMVVRQMQADRDSQFRPVAFVDDNPKKTGFSLSRLKVMGTRGDLPEIVRSTGAEGIVVCVNRPDSTVFSEIKEQADELGLRVLVFPSVNDALTPRSTPANLRDISVDDLVGRHPAKIDLSAVASYLSGKRVLVTGAGGSIGSELCRQIHALGPGELMMLDRDESGLHTTQMSIFGHGLLDTDDMVLADIRDADTLQRIFEERRPEVVFHAAALKHLPMLEQYPSEAWQTNVLGTLNVLRAALSVGVERFVNISTDKAADPTSILGHSKRAAERLTAWASEQDAGEYVSVRFGNVLGSRGSMLPTFQSQIERGGPVTITHPDVTRYFMTIPEACELVVQAGAIGRCGEVLILDMGEPVSILGVAKRMIQMSGRDIDITFTGLREGEKMHEDLFSHSEAHERPYHERISHAGVEALDPAALEFAGWMEGISNRSGGLTYH